MKWGLALFLIGWLVRPAAGLEIAGRYEWAEPTGEAGAFTQALHTAAASANALIRSLVRKQLAATAAPYSGVHFVETESGLAFDRVPGARPVVAVLNGPSIAWEREDGEVYQVAVAAATDGLVQQFTGAKGTRENRFQWSADGQTLRLTVTIRASVLKTPLVYTQTFRRTP